MDTFSERFGYAERSPIVYDRASAPSNFKEFVKGLIKIYVSDTYGIHVWLTDQLHEAPRCKREDAYRSDEAFSIINDANESMWYQLPWFCYYDCVEWVYASLDRANNENDIHEFSDRINQFFRANGIGWQLVDGKIIIRGDEQFEQTTKTAIDLASEMEKTTTVGEIKEAIHDLSKKPKPDLSGAMHHSMAALECLARDITGQPKLTLGKWIDANRDQFPSPVGDAVNQLWGYASNYGRHITEGNEPKFEEVELVVSLSATLCTYLMRKNGK
jgi:hypothetical protein